MHGSWSLTDMTGACSDQARKASHDLGDAAVGKCVAPPYFGSLHESRLLTAGRVFLSEMHRRPCAVSLLLFSFAKVVQFLFFMIESFDGLFMGG